MELAKYYNLLTLCARAPQGPSPLGRGRGVRDDHIHQAAAALPSWDPLPHLAEIHGLAPLVNHHLRAAEIALPETIERQLRAHAMRHTHANRIRARALTQILAFFSEANIDLLLLKGIAMAYAIYPRPGLRPMSDIDLLLNKTNADRGQKILTEELGFRPRNISGPPSSHHLPILHRQVDGVDTYIELHHNTNRRLLPETSFEALQQNARPITINNLPAYTPALEDLLTHTYNHMVDAPFQSFRLIWIADMVSLIERFGDVINWEQLPPRLHNALAAIHELTPFKLPRSQNVIANPRWLSLSKPGAMQSCQSAQPRGWPFNVTPAQNDTEYQRNIPKAFLPSSWWLRLYYGLTPEHWLLPVRIRYTIHIIGWIRQFRTPAHIIQHIREYFIRGIRDIRKNS